MFGLDRRAARLAPDQSINLPNAHHWYSPDAGLGISTVGFFKFCGFFKQFIKRV